MYHEFGSPLLSDEPKRVVRLHVGMALAALAGGLTVAAVFTLASWGSGAALAPTTSLYGPSAGCSADGPKYDGLSIDELREAVKAFVDTLGDDVKAHTYYPDAALQPKQWQICTIVQQCLVPKYGLPVARLTPVGRTRWFEILALVLSDESYKRIMVQQLSNLLLGEMQTWATTCRGECRELDDPSGLLPAHLLLDDTLDTHRINVSYDGCAALANAGRKTLWSCDESPRMLHHGNINTERGLYELGNVFKEPAIHARNHNFDYVAAYGSLEKGEPFGFRYSGHHFDLSFQIAADGTLTDLPTFLGHNPLIVPRAVPPQRGTHDHYLQWHNMAGVPQFPDATRVVLDAARALGPAGYVPLRLWDSTPANGGLTLKGGKEIGDVNHIDLAALDDGAFETVWALIDYTLEFARGARARPERHAFRTQGKMVWTTCVHNHSDADHHHGAGPPDFAHMPKSVHDLVHSRTFFYVRCETPELLFFAMVNSLFSLMLEAEPSNHLHSIVIEKKYLAQAPN